MDLISLCVQLFSHDVSRAIYLKGYFHNTILDRHTDIGLFQGVRDVFQTGDVRFGIEEIFEDTACPGLDDVDPVGGITVLAE